MLPDHFWASVAHDPLDLFPSRFLVAVHRAMGARGLVFSEPATFEAQVGVIRKRPALQAKIPLVMMVAAIDAHHCRDGLPLAGEAAIRECRDHRRIWRGGEAGTLGLDISIHIHILRVQQG